MSKLYECRPSSLFEEMDEYTAYCFDEACSYIQVMMQNEENEPDFKVEEDSSKQNHFKSARDLYKSMGYNNGSYTKILDNS